MHDRCHPRRHLLAGFVANLGKFRQVKPIPDRPAWDTHLLRGCLGRRHLGGDDCIFEREPLERLANEGQLMAYPHDGFFYAMDTYREYEYLNQLWNAKQAPWKVWQE